MARYIVVLMYVLAIIFIPFSIIYLVMSPRARRRALKTLALVLCLAILILTYRARPELQPQQESQVPPDMSLVESEAPVVDFVANPPQWAVLVTATGVAVLLAVGLVGVVWLLLQRSRRPDSPLEELAEQAEGAIEALQTGADLRDTVMRCYAEMCRVLREQQGIRRDASMTAREFEVYLVREGLPQRQVGKLTRLFEMVRYGTKVVGKRQELEAVDCLTAIAEACRSLP
jgi:hypothetical protein